MHFCAPIDHLKNYMTKFHGRSVIRAIEIDSDHLAVKLVAPGRLENHM